MIQRIKTLGQILTDPNVTLEEVKEFITLLPSNIRDYRINEERAVVWAVEDIQMEAQEMGITISPEDAEEVLDSITFDHDANVGVNWDVIRFHLENLLEREVG